MVKTKDFFVAAYPKLPFMPSYTVTQSHPQIVWRVQTILILVFQMQ